MPENPEPTTIGEPQRRNAPLPRAFLQRTRTLQFRRRRTSVRLEEVFWEYLEELARLQRSRLGPMIGRLAEDFRGGNLTAHLRAACMIDALRRLAATEVAGAHSRDPRADSQNLFHLTPCPGLLVSANATILDCNQAGLAWLGRPRDRLQGADLGSLLRLQMSQSFARFWETMVKGGGAFSVRPALVLLPGRLTAAEMTVVRLAPTPDRPAAFIVWLALPKAMGQTPAKRG